MECGGGKGQRASPREWGVVYVCAPRGHVVGGCPKEAQRKPRGPAGAEL